MTFPQLIRAACDFAFSGGNCILAGHAILAEIDEWKSFISMNTIDGYDLDYWEQRVNERIKEIEQ